MIRRKLRWLWLEHRWKLPWMRVSWEDFPKGLAESGQPVRGCLLDLRYGQIFDAGLHHYGEFFANIEFGWDLVREGLIVDGVRQPVVVIQRSTNAVQLKVRVA